jgi:branched-chain amino acid transport system permease protein
LPGLHYFIYGIVVIAVILLTPRGLLSYFELMSTRWRRR